MKIAKLPRVWALAVAATCTIGACNMITGADSLKIGPSIFDEQTPAGSSGAGGHDVGSSGVVGSGTQAGATSGVGSGGGDASGSGNGSTATSTGSGPPVVTGLVDGVTLVSIDLYQGIRRPIMDNGAPASSSIPVVAGKDGMLRIFYTTSTSYNGQSVTAHVVIGQGTPIEASQTLSGSSSQSSLSSTLNVDIPGSAITAGSDILVELRQPESMSTGSNAQASYQGSLGAEQGGKTLKIKLVPVKYGSKLPDTSQAQLDRYQKWFEGTYPIPKIEITVRSQPYTFYGNLNGYSGWSSLLNDVSDLRSSDGAPSDQYYYGVHDASGSGLLGLGWLGYDSTDNWARTAIGVGWTGDTAPETMIHELGHNHGRDHAPCGTSGDSSYPHSGASIGVWGYKPWSQKLLDPYDYVDFMSYCDPIWISDYTYKALFKRLSAVSKSPKLVFNPDLMNRSYDAIRVIDGQAEWKGTITGERPPMGTKKSVQIKTQGNGWKVVTGHYYPYNHITGGMLYVMRPKQYTLLEALQVVKFKAEGLNLSVSR
ncbi:MAG: M66 family metalloprotease [Polyangiaceae bacterium]